MIFSERTCHEDPETEKLKYLTYIDPIISYGVFTFAFSAILLPCRLINKIIFIFLFCYLISHGECWKVHKLHDFAARFITCCVIQQFIVQ